MHLPALISGWKGTAVPIRSRSGLLWLRPTVIDNENVKRSSFHYLDVLLVAVLVGRPGVVVKVEPGLPRQPAFIVEAGRGCDLVIGDLSRLHPKGVAAVERCRRRNPVK